MPKIWKPHPKQEKALLSKAFETLYGGARGGGKTDAGMAWMLYEKNNPKYRGLVIRRSYTDLTDWLDRAQDMYSGTGARFVGDEIRFPSGAKILVGHLGDDQAYMKYQGHEYHRMLIEELTQIPTLELYLKLISSCRSTVDIRPRIFATCNPGGPGHGWVKKRFVSPARPLKEFPDKISGRTRIYIPATVDDNPTLAEKDPDYVKFLDALPPDLKAQWRHGSWENIKIKGAIYGDDMMLAQKESRICSVAIRPDEQIHVAWDLGVSDDQVAWFVQFSGDQIRFVDLDYNSSKKFSYYIRMLQEKGYYYGTMYLPHDGTKRSADSLKSFKDVLEEAGFKVKIVARPQNKWFGSVEKSRTAFSRCWFDSEKCAKGVEALTHYRRKWNEQKTDFEKIPYHDWSSHFADAFQTLILSLKQPQSGAYDAAAKDYTDHDGIDRSRHITTELGGHTDKEVYDRAVDELLMS